MGQHVCIITSNNTQKTVVRSLSSFPHQPLRRSLCVKWKLVRTLPTWLHTAPPAWFASCIESGIHNLCIGWHRLLSVCFPFHNLHRHTPLAVRVAAQQLLIALSLGYLRSIGSAASNFLLLFKNHSKKLNQLLPPRYQTTSTQLDHVSASVYYNNNKTVLVALFTSSSFFTVTHTFFLLFL